MEKCARAFRHVALRNIRISDLLVKSGLQLHFRSTLRVGDSTSSGSLGSPIVFHERNVKSEYLTIEQESPDVYR